MSAAAKVKYTAVALLSDCNLETLPTLKMLSKKV